MGSSDNQRSEVLSKAPPGQQPSPAHRSPQPIKLTMIQGWFMNSVMVILWVGSVFSRFRISIFTMGARQRTQQLRGQDSSEDGQLTRHRWTI